MNGWAIAGAPLGAGGLVSPAERFPGAHPEPIRIDAALAVAAETREARAMAESTARVDPADRARATRP